MRTLQLLIFFLLFFQIDLNSQSIEPNKSNYWFYFDMGIVKSMYYQSMNSERNKIGVITLGGGILKTTKKKKSYYFSSVISLNGPFGECFDDCDNWEHLSSVNFSVRRIYQQDKSRFRLGIGPSINYYNFNNSGIYNESTNMYEGSIYEQQLGIGINLSSYLLLNEKVYFGIDYNPNFFDFMGNRFSYLHTCMVGFKFRIL